MTIEEALLDTEDGISRRCVVKFDLGMRNKLIVVGCPMWRVNRETIHLHVEVSRIVYYKTPEVSGFIKATIDGDKFDELILPNDTEVEPVDGYGMMAESVRGK